MSDSSSGVRIHVNGIVQGVGFRPFVYNLAVSLRLAGWVRNTSSGVDIVLTGEPTDIDLFLNELRTNPPNLAHIDSISILPNNENNFIGFRILQSSNSPDDFLPISPDVCTCSQCRAELFDPVDRRFRYPFINCTNCGPRFTIIRDIPYDRPLTTMAGFAMCDECASEYHDPTDRRYHAQPIACPVCGPRVEYFETGVPRIMDEDAIQAARSAIMRGKVLAVKGLGGFHLACDAFNQNTLTQLHERKQRSDKPFALMAFDLQTIRKFALVDAVEEKCLLSPQHPIVILRKLPGVTALDLTAPGQTHLGFMLPYTPLHLLLLEPAPHFPPVLVMTSGNLSEEPIAYKDQDAYEKLSPLADCYLSHNRPIHMRVDDSVVRFVGNYFYPIRRSRGYAPDPIRLTKPLIQALACGAELKNTFALSKSQYVFISHHIGDLENQETLNSFEEGVIHYKNLFRVHPEVIAVDLHPDYLSTRYGECVSASENLPLIRTQHHHAHLAACLADNNIPESDPVIGLIFDGTGYGSDGHIWGGEVLIGGYTGFTRRFHLQEMLLPGGDSAIRNPSKIALAQLFASGMDWDASLAPVRAFSPDQLAVLKKQLTLKLNCVETSSMGRLFDAISSILGIRQRVTYEGQAAIELENLVDPQETGFYPVQMSGSMINSLDLFPMILNDFHAGTSLSCISARFHNSIAQICLDCCEIIRSQSNLNRVALSGGVWQNTTLLLKSLALLRNAGFEVLTHQRVPTNDGGIALGQLVIADAIISN